MAAELGLQTRAGAASFGLHQAFDGGAVLEETGCSTGIARVSRGGELHAASIGIAASPRNPWRE